MLKLTAEEISLAVAGRIIRGSGAETAAGASTDTRSVRAGSLFFALKGEYFDAHDFLADVPDDMCRIIVVSRPETVPAGFSGAVIAVDDTLVAYQDLAAYVRMRMSPKVIGVTGSVGKTSLKDMIARICSEKFKTISTDMNYNNEIGVPMTILSMPEGTEVLVLEMGMDHAGEIERLARIARPDVAVIGNIGLSHRENFGSDDGIYLAKMEITTFLHEGNALVVNGDDEYLRQVADLPGITYAVVTAGTGAVCDFVAKDIAYVSERELGFRIEHGGESARFSIPAAGKYNGVTAALASAAVSELGVTLEQSAEALRTLKRTPHRLDLITANGVKVIDDVYNASPSSMASGIEYLMAVSGERKIAVLAGMNELGDDSRGHHRDTGKQAARAGVDMVVTVGEKARDIADGAGREAHAARDGKPQVMHFDDNASAA
ncbi:MAG: UDP-N-acetylmuramoyl-tripeptide--D-alanyl-D-alanine ligase, partial [Clostridiales Family XIII bacterium]|nr:UDP-N-acetylmuramoyl-tripeptide--D-alanyl-D-alanine ligase [Clostridiales Family XIII bacterium]